jgi:hypothetical protein
VDEYLATPDDRIEEIAGGYVEDDGGVTMNSEQSEKLGQPLNYPFEQMTFASDETRVVRCFMHADVVVERIVLPSSPRGRLELVDGVKLGIQILASGVEYERLVSLEGPSAIPAFVARIGQSIEVALRNNTSEEIVLEGAFACVSPILGRWVFDSTIQTLRDRGKALLASEDTAVYARGWIAAFDALEQRSPPIVSFQPWATEVGYPRRRPRRRP